VVDVQRWERLSILGPPPPARFDFAMCAVKVPVLRRRDAADTKTSEDGSVKEADCRNTALEITSNKPARKPKKDEEVAEKRIEADRKTSSKESSFHAITIVDSEGVSPTNSASDSTTILSDASQVASDIQQHGGGCGELHWIDTLYIFGGIDSSGEVHSDSFLISP